MPVSPARHAAFEILRRVEQESAYSSALLASLGDEVNSKDRALAHELVLGVLRRRLWLDRTIEHFAGRGLAKLDLAVVDEADAFLRHVRFGRDGSELTTRSYAGGIALFLRWCTRSGRHWHDGAVA